MTLIDRLLTTFRRSLRKSPPAPPLRPDELQRLFTTRYRCFRELLAANTNTLEAMAEMETALRDGRTLSMTFIRSRCTTVTVNVFKIIHNLNKISDDRYKELDRVFSRLQQSIETLLDGEKAGVNGELILPLTSVSRKQVELTGEKMANLGEAGSLSGVRIPPGFAVTAAATRLFFHRNQLYPKINHTFQQLDIANLRELHTKSAALQQMIQDCPLPPELEPLLYDHFDRLAAGTPDLKIAVRSSALCEDLGRASFAGLYHTELDVDREQLVAAYKSVLASKYSPRAISYRLARGFRHEESEMCVGCLAMIEAAVSGICYTRSIGGRSETLDLFFAPGAARSIVDGTDSTSHYLVERTEPHRIVIKHMRAGGEQDESLTEAQASALAAIGMRLERHFGAPQDIEWSIDRTGSIFVLQSRPIPVARLGPEPDAPVLLTDERLLLHGGVTGCSGAGCGPVFVVRTSADMLRFPKRAVLVVKHPLPEWAPLLKRAAALVAETGSEAGHLATLSREFGLPALLALDKATLTLTPGETVTVDATNRAVYRGRIEEMLTPNPQQPNPMDGSPVQQTLISVLKLITPLNLTDPAVPAFHPAHCRSMHDITRFCHEKSVIEMFEFGKRTHFDQGTAKRLADSLPLEWWVIDLGDGFQPGFDAGNSQCTINDIACTPMLALWEGMHAVPWQGPPAAGLRTMVSFLFQAALQDSLDPSRSTALMEKNYFLISKNYCNLSVRLGYHYAMIEAMLGNRPIDRYLTFRFKGGAAGEEQRERRIELLAEILEKFEYRIDLTGDALTARVDRGSEKFLRDRLKILGYLTIHTRQLDMVMSNDREQRFFCNKFIEEIEEMLTHDQ